MRALAAMFAEGVRPGQARIRCLCGAYIVATVGVPYLALDASSCGAKGAHCPSSSPPTLAAPRRWLRARPADPLRLGPPGATSPVELCRL